MLHGKIGVHDCSLSLSLSLFPLHHMHIILQRKVGGDVPSLKLQYLMYVNDSTYTLRTRMSINAIMVTDCLVEL